MRKLGAFFTNPFVGAAMAVIGVLSAFYSVYASESAKQYGLMKYRVVNDVVYNPAEISGLDDLKPNYFPGTAQKVHLTEITLWNSGSISFEPKDARSDVEITGDSNFIIIDHKIINFRSSVSGNFTTSKVGPSRLKIEWKVFDPGDALKIALINIGDPESVLVAAKFGPAHQLKRFVFDKYFGMVAPVVGVISFLFISFTIGFRLFTMALKLQGFRLFAATISLFVITTIATGAVSYGILYVIVYYNGDFSPISTELEKHIS